MAAATPLIISTKSQEALVAFHKECYGVLNNQWNLRSNMRQIDLAYIREQDYTLEHQRAKLANRLGDSSRFQNITVPIVKPQVESALKYQAAVFLNSDPLFGFVASPGNEDIAMQYQAVIEENARRGSWVSEIIKFLRDGFKYNLSALEVSWSREVTHAVETDINFSVGKEGKPKQIIWEGNCIHRWDMYNTFFDTRYAPTEVYKNGEFIGKTEVMSRVHLKKFINELPDKMISNIKAAFESGLGSINTSDGEQSYYIPPLNPDINITSTLQTTNWMAWAGALTRPEGEMNYKNVYEVSTLYARIIPQDFRLNVPSANTPQIWKFIIINNQVLIYAERQTNAHGYLPVLLGQPNDDGLGYQTKSLATDAIPFQQISSALVNSAMAARRRALSDRTIFDPSRILSAHINSDNPSAKIPLRPAGYGKPASESVYAFPFRDDQSAVAFQELPQVISMADKLNGQNPVRQGQFVKGNKNNPEFEATMAGASGQDQLRALILEDQVFTPAREIIKLNILQYQAGTSIFSPAQKRAVKIDPIALRKAAATFTTTDGLSTAEKQMHTDEFTVALQTIGSSPQISAGYNIAPMFSYIMKLRNVDLKPFEKSPQQMAYEQALRVWQQQSTLALEKGTQFTSPQPLPQQFGYVPGQTAENAAASQSTISASNPTS
jgi:hypothetical protein